MYESRDGGKIRLGKHEITKPRIKTEKFSEVSKHVQYFEFRNEISEMIIPKHWNQNNVSACDCKIFVFDFARIILNFVTSRTTV